jgi:hypothetical protein
MGVRNMKLKGLFFFIGMEPKCQSPKHMTWLVSVSSQVHATYFVVSWLPKIPVFFLSKGQVSGGENPYVILL